VPACRARHCPVSFRILDQTIWSVFGGRYEPNFEVTLATHSDEFSSGSFTRPQKQINAVRGIGPEDGTSCSGSLGHRP